VKIAIDGDGTLRADGDDDQNEETQRTDGHRCLIVYDYRGLLIDLN
jgi:hypothetical protein